MVILTKLRVCRYATEIELCSTRFNLFHLDGISHYIQMCFTASKKFAQHKGTAKQNLYFSISPIMRGHILEQKKCRRSRQNSQKENTSYRQVMKET